MTTITVAKDFAQYPFGRFRTDGDYSGQRFREEFLEKELKRGADVVTVVLDGARGLGSSFLEEAFGGLVRAGFEASVLDRRLNVVSKDATRIAQIKGYIIEAQEKKR